MGLNIVDILNRTPRSCITGMNGKDWYECANGRLDCNLGECPESLEDAGLMADEVLVRTVAKAVIRENAESNPDYYGGSFNRVRRPEVVDRIEGKNRSNKRKKG